MITGQIITFTGTGNARRTPVPARILLAMVSDNECERIAFQLPAVATGQTATINWIVNGGTTGRIVALDYDAATGLYYWTPDATDTIAERELLAYVQITDGADVIWSSDTITMTVKATPGVTDNATPEEVAAIPALIAETATAIAECEDAAAEAIIAARAYDEIFAGNAPTLHSDTHKAGGTDEIDPADIGAAPDDYKPTPEFLGVPALLHTHLSADITDGPGDTGWADFTLANGTHATDNHLQYRKLGRAVYIEGAFTGVASTSIAIATLPETYRPEKPLQWSRQMAYLNPGVGEWMLQIDSNGVLTYKNTSAGAADDTNYVCTSFPVTTGAIDSPGEDQPILQISFNGTIYVPDATGAITIPNTADEIEITDADAEYTSTTVEGALHEIAVSLALKAPAATTYSRIQTDAAIATAVDPVTSQLAEKANLVTGKNKFDKTAVLDGYVLDTNGALIALEGYSVSDYIQIDPGHDYYVHHAYMAYAVYDADKTLISAAAATPPLHFTAPENAKYVRFCIYNAYLDKTQFEEGDARTSYEQYELALDVSKLPTKPFVTENMIVPGAVGVSRTDFIKTGRNLFDKSDVTVGKFVNNTTGNLDTGSGYVATGFIPVDAEADYTATTGFFQAYYDDGKSRIGGLGNSASPGNPRTFTTPPRAAYVRCSVYTGGGMLIDAFQVQEGSEATPTEEYGYVIPKLIPQGKDVFLNLAPIIPAVVGHEVNIYFDNIMCVDDLRNYQINVTCAKGKQQRERWTYVPVAGDVGDIPIVIDLYKDFDFAYRTSSIIRVAAANAGAGQTLKTLIIGDSTTAGNDMITELANLFSTDDMGLSFIGTQGVSPNFHEGWSGKTTNWIYANALSPFVVSGAFSFSSYLSTHTFDAPDIVIINLGINDVTTATSDAYVSGVATAMCAQYDAMIAQFKAANANVKVGVCIPVPAGNADAFGDANGCGQTSWRHNRNIRILADALIDYYKGKEAQNIHLVPINVNLDTVNNVLLSDPEPVNARNPLTIQRQRNGVHPGLYGYYQIADMVYYWIKCISQ